MLLRSLLTFVINASLIHHYAAAQASDPLLQRTRDVIYGRSWGTALTMDVIAPKEKRNGLGVIWVVSGGWFSSPDAITKGNIDLFVGELLRRGYTVFAVVHGSQPKFTIPEAIADLNRAVRFIRHHAKDYDIDPDRIGIFGGSAGGHLSVTQGVNPAATPNPNAPDPVERASTKVQAVAAFFPPTDFLNYGAEGKMAIGAGGILQPFQAAFDFRVFDDKLKKFVTVTDDAQIRTIAKQISPIYHVDSSDPPTLILHGDADVLVPYEQVTRLMKKFEEAKVPARLITKPGAGHGWAKFKDDMPTIAGWFDTHLANAAPATTQPATTQSATTQSATQ